jgi:hypothetical protein
MFNFTLLPDPNSLPALLHRPPGLIPGPIPAPQLGQSPGFRPPPLMGAPQMPGMPGMPPQQTPGFNVQDGMGMLGGALSRFPGFSVQPTGPQGTGAGGTYTPADAAAMARGAGLDIPGAGMPEDANLGNSVAAIQNLQPGPNGQFAPVSMPTDIGYGQGGSFGLLPDRSGFGRIVDFLTGRS